MSSIPPISILYKFIILNLSSVDVQHTTYFYFISTMYTVSYITQKISIKMVQSFSFLPSNMILSLAALDNASDYRE